MVKYRQFIFVIILVYLGLNLSGLLPWNIFKPDSVNYSPNFTAFFAGLMGLSLPLLVRQKAKEIDYERYEYRYAGRRKILFFAFRFILLVSLVSIFTINVRGGGIILFSNMERFSNSAFLTIIGQLAIAIILIVYTTNRIYNLGKTITIHWYLVIYIIALLSLGYRTPIIVLVGSVAVINVITVEKSLIFNKVIIIGSIAGVLVMSLIEQFRVEQDYTMQKFYKTINFKYVSEHEWVAPLVPAVSLFRYDQTVVSTLIRKTGTDYKYGSLFASNFLTVLPGEQLGARNIIGKMIGARNMPNSDVPWSITPTLQGALYVDGGYTFIFIGFLVPSLFCLFLIKRLNKKYSPGNISAAAYVFVNILKSLHSGYLDMDFFFVIFFIYTIDFFLIKRIVT